MTVIQFDVFDLKRIYNLSRHFPAIMKKYFAAVQRSCKRLAVQVGTPVVRRAYEFGDAFYDGENNDYTITAQQTDNGWQIVAQGFSVGFLEFGTGRQAATDAGIFADEVSYPVGESTWSVSEEGSGMYASRGYWFWKRNRYVSTPQTAGMQQAYEAIVREAPRIIEEEFAKIND